MSYLVNAVFGLELARNRRATHRRCVRPNPPGAPGESTPAGALCVGGPKMGLPRNRQVREENPFAISVVYATQAAHRDAVLCVADQLRYGPSVPLPYSFCSALLETAFLHSDMRT